jgi:Ca2+-transporting ATPase
MQDDARETYIGSLAAREKTPERTGHPGRQGPPGASAPGDYGYIYNVTEQARTMAFSTLVLAQLFKCFNARSDRASAFHQLFTNPLLWSAIALSASLQVAVVQMPFLNDAFHTTPLALDDWLICVGLASIVLWADEAKKLLGRRQRR